MAYHPSDFNQNVDCGEGGRGPTCHAHHGDKSDRLKWEEGVLHVVMHSMEEVPRSCHGKMLEWYCKLSCTA